MLRTQTIRIIHEKKEKKQEKYSIMCLTAPDGYFYYKPIYSLFFFSITCIMGTKYKNRQLYQLHTSI